MARTNRARTNRARTNRAWNKITPILGLVVLASLVTGQAMAASKITRVLLVSETTDSVVLEVHYSYDGRQGDRVFASAQMTQGGKVLKHYGYRPGNVERGNGRTRVTLGVNKSAPALFTSNGLRVKLYRGGGGAIATSNVQFAKSWAKPRAALSPMLKLVATVRPIKPGRVLAVPGQSGGGSGDGGSDGGGVATRSIHPDGTVEIRRPDGTRILLRDGSKTIISPDGSEQVQMYSSAQPPTPPGAPPNAQHGAWVEGEAARLLDIIRTLVGHDQPSVDAYLQSEGGQSLYGKVSERTDTIGKLVLP